MATTRTLILDDVFRRLGDRGYFNATSLPSVATLASARVEIYRAIVALVMDMEGLGVRPLNASGTLAIVADTREYDLDATLANLSPSGSVFRAHLFIERTDQTNPVPARWSHDGDYRVREMRRQRFNWPDFGFQGSVAGSSDSPLLYRRGRSVGYATTPTATQTLTCYFSPVVVDFASGTDGDAETLTTINLEALEPWVGLIADKAALQLMSDVNSGQYQLVRDQYAEERHRFLGAVADQARVSGYPRRSRWTG